MSHCGTQTGIGHRARTHKERQDTAGFAEIKGERERERSERQEERESDCEKARRDYCAKKRRRENKTQHCAQELTLRLEEIDLHVVKREVLPIVVHLLLRDSLYYRLRDEEEIVEEEHLPQVGAWLLLLCHVGHLVQTAVADEAAVEAHEVGHEVLAGVVLAAVVRALAFAAAAAQILGDVAYLESRKSLGSRSRRGQATSQRARRSPYLCGRASLRTWWLSRGDRCRSVGSDQGCSRRQGLESSG